jgi:UPF0716 protein FxsA
MPVAFLIFILVPIAEIYVLIRVGSEIGAWPTIGLVLLTAIVGVALLRQQGLSTLARGMGRLDRGQLPAQEMVEGMLLAIAGALLLTPGFLTDGIGFLLLLPPTRLAVVRWLLDRMIVGGPGPAWRQRHGHQTGRGPFEPYSDAGSRAETRPGSAGRGSTPDHRRPGQVIEGDFERRDP